MRACSRGGNAAEKPVPAGLQSPTRPLALRAPRARRWAGAPGRRLRGKPGRRLRGCIAPQPAPSIRPAVVLALDLRSTAAECYGPARLRPAPSAPCGRCASGWARLLEDALILEAAARVPALQRVIHLLDDLRARRR